MSGQLTSAENNLKSAYNAYIDAMVAYLNQVKAESDNDHPITTYKVNNAPLYLLDHVKVGCSEPYAELLAKVADINSLLARKVE